MAFIEFDKVSKIYRSGQVEIAALREASFEIEKGELCVIVGQSGAGKTTLLNILGGMDTLSDGSVRFDGKNVGAFSVRQLSEYRRREVGFVFQFYNLIGNLTALENVEMAARLEKGSLSPEQVLREVGLGDRMQNFPAQLSGGEQQRVSIARALVKNPKLLLCDEPTGALDYETGKTILSLLQRSCRERGTTVVIITHNQALCPMADRVIRVKNGKIKSCECNPSPTPIEQIEW
jgi:putative ABC transport system ATP-binding protein